MQNDCDLSYLRWWCCRSLADVAINSVCDNESTLITTYQLSGQSVTILADVRWMHFIFQNLQMVNGEEEGSAIGAYVY